MITRIAQISDTHLSPTKPYFRSNFDLVAEHLRVYAPDLVINSERSDVVASADAIMALLAERGLIDA